MNLPARNGKPRKVPAGTPTFFRHFKFVHAGRHLPGRQKMRQIEHITIENARPEINRLVGEAIKKRSFMPVRALLVFAARASDYDVAIEALSRIGEIGEQWKKAGLFEGQREKLRHDLVLIAHQKTGSSPHAGLAAFQVAEKITGRPLDPETEGFRSKEFHNPDR